MFRAWLTTPHRGLISRREASGSRLLAVPVVYLIVALFGLPLGTSSYASATDIAPGTLAIRYGGPNSFCAGELGL